MSTIVVYEDSLSIPDGINSLQAFRRRFRTDDFPEIGRICYLSDQVWADMSKEQIFTHNQLKQEFNLVIGGLVKSRSLGRYFPDGLFLTNDRADMACQPDGTFLSKRNFDSRQTRLVAAENGGFLELEGSPDMVLEIVSTSSVEKDTRLLRDLYWRAGIAEYWLVDGREGHQDFTILASRPPADKQAE